MCEFLRRRPCIKASPRLARRFAFDLRQHPALGRPRPGAPDYVFARLLCCYAPGAAPRSEAELEPLRSAAQEAYGPVGRRALALFEERAREERERRGARSRRPDLA